MDNGLAPVDSTRKKAPRHMAPSSTDNEFETPENIYYDECVAPAVSLGESAPELDPFTSIDKNGRINSKCIYNLTIDDDVYNNDLLLPDGKVPSGIWSNHPHTLHEETVELMHEQHKKFGFTIIMIIPSNTRRTKYWTKYIEPYRYGGNPKYNHIKNHIRNWPIPGTIRFLQNGVPSKDTSRNAYEVLVWCQKK